VQRQLSASRVSLRMRWRPAGIDGMRRSGPVAEGHHQSGDETYRSDANRSDGARADDSVAARQREPGWSRLRPWRQDFLRRECGPDVYAFFTTKSNGLGLGISILPVDNRKHHGGDCRHPARRPGSDLSVSRCRNATKILSDHPLRPSHNAFTISA